MGARGEGVVGGGCWMWLLIDMPKRARAGNASATEARGMRTLPIQLRRRAESVCVRVLRSVGEASRGRGRTGVSLSVRRRAPAAPLRPGPDARPARSRSHRACVARTAFRSLNTSRRAVGQKPVRHGCFAFFRPRASRRGGHCDVSESSTEVVSPLRTHNSPRVHWRSSGPLARPLHAIVRSRRSGSSVRSGAIVMNI